MISPRNPWSKSINPPTSSSGHHFHEESSRTFSKVLTFHFWPATKARERYQPIIFMISLLFNKNILLFNSRNNNKRYHQRIAKVILSKTMKIIRRRIKISQREMIGLDLLNVTSHQPWPKSTTSNIIWPNLSHCYWRSLISESHKIRQMIWIDYHRTFSYWLRFLVRRRIWRRPRDT